MGTIVGLLAFLSADAVADNVGSWAIATVFSAPGHAMSKADYLGRLKVQCPVQI
ncbi:MAG: hypothetical protein AAGH67_03055 [Cyanobacteria bacterium P01_H01_bin.162]